MLRSFALWQTSVVPKLGFLHMVFKPSLSTICKNRQGTYTKESAFHGKDPLSLPTVYEPVVFPDVIDSVIDFLSCLLSKDVN